MPANCDRAVNGMEKAANFSDLRRLIAYAPQIPHSANASRAS